MVTTPEKHLEGNWVAGAVTASFLLGGLFMCLGVGAVMAYTSYPGEDILSLFFWPTVGMVSFGTGVFYQWATRPWGHSTTQK